MNDNTGTEWPPTGQDGKAVDAGAGGSKPAPEGLPDAVQIMVGHQGEPTGNQGDPALEPTAVEAVGEVASDTEQPAVIIKDRKTKKEEAVARLEAEFLEGNQDKPDEAREAFKQHLGEIEKGTDTEKIVDAYEALKIDGKEELELLMPEDNEPKLKEVTDLYAERRRSEIVDKIGLQGESREQVLEIIKKLQNADRELSDAEIIEDVTKLNLNRAATEVILKQMGYDDAKIKDLLDRVEEKKSVKEELQAETAKADDKEAEEKAPTPQDIDKEISELKEQLEGLAQARKEGKEVPHGIQDLILEKFNKLNETINNMSTGQKWGAVGIILLLAFLVGTFGAMSIIGTKKKQ